MEGEKSRNSLLKRKGKEEEKILLTEEEYETSEDMRGLW